MLKLKDLSVIVTGLQWQIAYALGVAEQAFADEGLDCIVAAGINGQHNAGSLHAQGLAVDIRNSSCTAEQHERILGKLARLNNYGFDVVDEKPGATQATTGQHFHIEFQPKPGEKFWHVLGE